MPWWWVLLIAGHVIGWLILSWKAFAAGKHPIAATILLFWEPIVLVWVGLRLARREIPLLLLTFPPSIL